ncbi:MAG: alpha/beta hydrolase [Candidatus Doudnabacteria bacterium]|nr:alpha/beta hydrolase [Candidatus Doudnabacteria bacterium]
MKKQIIVIGGGDTFADEDYEKYLQFLRDLELDYERLISDKSDWKRGLRRELGDKYEIMLPSMPNKFNARFAEWSLWFEKLFPFLHDQVVLVGHSLGGAFLAKYLTENGFPKEIQALFLVSAVFDADTDGNPLWSFALPEKLVAPANEIFIYHSKDDPVVPFSDMQKYQLQFPNASVRVFENRGHMNQEQFPEIVEDIRSL